MLPIIPVSGSKPEKQLLQYFRQLNAADQATLLKFASFLANSSTMADNALAEHTATPTFPEPQPIPRPTQESVIKAIKRLTATYPMIGRDQLLNETSNLMAAHVLQGKAAPQVIDELEALFLRHYTALQATFEQTTQQTV